MLVNHGNSSDLSVVEETKKCYVCGVEKPLSKFAQKRGKRDSRCKECRNKKFRERYRRIRNAKKKYRSVPIQKVVDVCFHGDGMDAIRQKTVESIIANLVLDVFTEKYSYE
jgi:hypothetical protein